ncbi:MAG: pyrimidine dimer DNA glycosylase/endonuclease V [Planctomycetota bacterium]|jgi:hypothetical protein
MNIFVLDLNPEKCARYHVDRHVIKMVEDGARMLCTVVNLHGGKSPYRSTQPKHPCTLWAGRSLSNWEWLRSLTLALNREHRHRFDREEDLPAAAVVRRLQRPRLPKEGLTDFPQMIPEKYRVPGDPVRAYRAYYIGEKSVIALWTHRRTPPWFAAWKVKS